MAGNSNGNGGADGGDVSAVVDWLVNQSFGIAYRHQPDYFPCHLPSFTIISLDLVINLWLLMVIYHHLFRQINLLHLSAGS